jgi:hypothetical protein
LPRSSDRQGAETVWHLAPGPAQGTKPVCLDFLLLNLTTFLGPPLPRLKRRGVDVPHSMRGPRRPVGRGPGTLSCYFFICCLFFFVSFSFLKIEQIRNSKNLIFWTKFQI